MTHPSYILESEAPEKPTLPESVNPSAPGVAPRILRKAISAALERAPALPEWQDLERLRFRGRSDGHNSPARAHASENTAELEPDAPTRRRLA